MALDPETVGGWLATAITAVLGKVGWDKYQKSRRQESISINPSDELDLNKPLDKSQTLAVWLSDRIHKAVNDLNPHFNRINADLLKQQGEINELKVRQTHTETAVKDNEARFEKASAEIHRHIESSAKETRDQLSREVDRLWQRLDELKK